METIIGGGDGSPPADLIKDTTVETFEQDVITASLETPVIVDFWGGLVRPVQAARPGA